MGGGAHQSGCLRELRFQNRRICNEVEAGKLSPGGNGQCGSRS